MNKFQLVSRTDRTAFTKEKSMLRFASVFIVVFSLIFSVVLVNAQQTQVPAESLNLNPQLPEFRDGDVLTAAQLNNLIIHILNLTTAQQALQGELASAQNSLALLQSVQSSVAQATANIAVLQTDVGTAQTAAESAQASAGQAQAGVVSAQASADQAQAAADSAQTTADSAQASATSAQASADQAQSGVATAQTDITTLQSNVTTIQTSNFAALDPYIRVEAGEKSSAAQVVFDSVNVVVTNGTGSTNTANGLGNLIVGYNESGGTPASPGDRDGSHNIVLGPSHSYSSTGGFVAGENNELVGRSSSILGGFGNVALGLQSTVAGGGNNDAAGPLSSIGGWNRSRCNRQCRSCQWWRRQPSFR